jgi:glutaredoxin
MVESRRSLLILIGAILLLSAGTQLWDWREQLKLGREMASAAKPGDIMMLASDTCEYCAMARAYMRQHAVPYTECSIERDAQCAARYQGLKSPGTPVMLVRGQAQVGFMPSKVLERLSRS